MVSPPTEAPDSVTKPKPDVTAPTDRITQQAQAGADNLSATSPFRAGKDTTSATTTDTQVKSASEQMSMGAGIGTAGKTESFQTSDGGTIQGQTYTSKDGTFMKVAGGQDGKGSTYQIEQGDNGQRSLTKIDPDGTKEPVALRQNDGANNGRAPEATPTPGDRAPQAQQPEVHAEKAPPVEKAPEKAPTAAPPEAAISGAPKLNSTEPSLAAAPERQAPPAADAPSPSPSPRGEQSFVPPAHNDAPSPQVHNATQVAASPPQLERAGSGGSDRLGGPNGSGSGYARGDEQYTPPVQHNETSPSPHANGASEAPLVPQAGHEAPKGNPVADAAPAATPGGRANPTIVPPAEAAPAPAPAQLGRGGAGDGGNRELSGGRDPEKHVGSSNDASQAAPTQPYRQAPTVADSSGSLGGTKVDNSSGYRPEASPPPFASPPAQGPKGDVRGDVGFGRPGDQDGAAGKYQKGAGNDGVQPSLPPRNNGTVSPGGSGGELANQQRGPNAEGNVNARQALQDSSPMSGLKSPGAEAAGPTGRPPGDSFAPTEASAKNGIPSANATGAGAEAAALNAASRAGADNAALNLASRSGTEAAAMNAAMLAASKPGAGDALAKVSAPHDVLAPSAAQNKMLQQAGFNANNPADAAFLASARAQLLSTNLHDGATLATALNGANQANLNKLAVLLTGKADATANNVVLNEANMARLNALFKPDASAMHAGMAMSLDAKNAAALGLTNVLAGRQPALTQMSQREVYGELNKLGSQLVAGQTLAIGDLVSRNLIRPTDLVAGVGLLANKLEPLEIKPTTGTLTPSHENALATANAIAAARSRALDVNGEVIPGKPIALVPHTDLAEGLGLLPGALVPGGLVPGKGLPIEGKLPEGADKIADSRIGLGGKPIALTTAEAILNTKAAADAARSNATKNIEGEGPQGADLILGARKDMADLGEKLDPKKKPEGKGESQGISIDGSLLTGAALRLFGDKKDEKKDETNASSKVDETKSQRRKYLVKEGDTLDSIAQEGFGDSKMSVLIAAVNSEVIANDTDPDALLQVGLNIWLPSEMEVEDFLGNVKTQVTNASQQKLTPEEELTRRFGNGWDGAKNPTADAEPQPDLITAASAAIAASVKRRENVEKLLGPLTEKKIDYITYTVRLGDTLKSIATKHPSLKDVALWELVASVNELTVPGNNASAVKLTRGSSLKLPTAAEIEEFRNANSSKKPLGNGPISGPRTGATTGARSIIIPPGNPLANTVIDKQDARVVDEHAITRASAPIRDAGASLLRAGGFVKDQPKTHDDATIVTSPLEKLPRPEISKPITTDKPSVENIKNLSADCRIVRRHQVDASGRLYQAQLEVLRDGVWTSVMMYNISDGNCWRKSINELGVTEVLQLDLPTAAIHQMLESDFANNWQEYRDRTLSTASAY